MSEAYTLVESREGGSIFKLVSRQVVGVVVINEDGDALSILEWSSLPPRGRGATTRVLEALRQDFAHIHVVGIGYTPTDPSWTYWLHMRDKGLVDTLEDDEGREA